VKFFKFGKLQMLSGTFPLNILFAMSTTSIFCRYSKSTGRSPINLLLLISITFVPFNRVISSGKQPERALFERRTSSNVFPILPMLLGMHPMNLLLEITITEAGEFPKFSGMVEWNRLWFTKIASRCLLNNSGGNGPSKSLNLMSRYLRSGNLNTTWGKDPTNRLLLRSSSKRIVSLEMLLGMTPQNLLEFR